MRKISIKTIISILSAKFTLFLTKTILKGGTTFPGRVALKIDKNILSKISKGYKVILVTGTNGKTTTTSMIYNIIKESGHPVITNNTGANLFPGIVTTFVDNFKFGSKVKDNYAVIEVDEANLKYITEYITPEVITVTNLFRDQLDRYGEVYTTLIKILEGIYNVPETTLVLNGDESLLGKLDLKNPRTFNEKLQWLKLYYYPQNDLAVKCADKYRVREYIKDKGYENTLVPLLGAWDNVEDIDWDSLPNKFVLKCNHGCAYNIVCNDKTEFDRIKAKKQLNTWLKEDFGAFNIEPHYSNIKKHKSADFI